MDAVDFLALAFFTIALSIFAPNSHAGTFDIGQSNNISVDANGNLRLANPVSGKTSLVYPDLVEQRTTSIPTSKGNIPVTIEQKSPVSLGGVAGAVIAIAKATPYGKALVVASVICELTDICKSAITGQFEQKVTPTPTLTPNTLYTINNYTAYPNSTPTGSCQAYVDSVRVYNPAHVYKGVALVGASLMCQTVNNTAGCNPCNIATVFQTPSCPANYHMSGTTCFADAGLIPTYHAPTESDWSIAEPKLAVQAVVNPFIATGDPVPVTTPITQPKTVNIEDKTTTLRDSAGTAIGTEHKKTDLKVTPAPIAGKPNQVTTTETTYNTTTNLTNNTSIQNTTESGTPETVEPEPPTVEINDVPEVDLPTHNIVANYSPISWGGATCPPDPVANTSIGSFTLPVHTVCSFLDMARPIILLLAGLAAAMIISGVKYD